MIATQTARHFHFASKDGMRISCSRWGDCASSLAAVQIAHGLGEHIGRYAEVIDFLVSNGLVVYGNDHRGHGRSAPSANHFGNFGPGGFGLLAEDVFELTIIARNENPEKPFILLGHSMGSFAAQLCALDHSNWFDGLVLSGSGTLDGLVQLARSVPEGCNVLNAPFEPARTPFDWLSRDKEKVDAFIKDPLCFGALQPASNESFFSFAPALADPFRLRQICSDLPIYLFSGSDDPVGQRLEGLRILIERYYEAGMRKISHDFYPGGRHEMLNEINRAQVQANLCAWIGSVVERKRRVGR